MASLVKDHFLTSTPSKDYSKEEKFRQDNEVTSKRLNDVFAESDKTEELDPKIKSVVKNRLVQKAIKKSKRTKGADVFSVVDFEILNKRFMAGHLPRNKPKHHIKNNEDDEDDDDDDEDDSNASATGKKTAAVSVMSKVLKYQLHVMIKAKGYALKHASKIGNSWLKTVIPTSQIATLISFVIYTYLLNEEFLLFFLPLSMFAIGFTVLVVSTLRSLRGEKRFKEFVAWSELLRSIESALNVDEAEDNYFKNHISPLLSLPPAVIIIVMSFSICTYNALPVAELSLVSLGMGIACLVSFYQTISRHALIAILLQVFATFLESFGRLSDSDTGFFNFAIFSWNGFQMNVSLSIICRCLSFSFVMSLLFYPKRRSVIVAIIRNLVPCLYVMLWWEMFSLLFYFSSTFGLLRAVLEMIALFFSIPSAVALFIYALFSWVAALNFMRTLATLSLLALPLFYMKLSRNSFQFISKLYTNSIGPALKIILFLVVAAVSVTVFLFYKPSGLQVPKSMLTLNDYYNFCRRPTNSIKAFSKRACHQFNGHHVAWSGVVEEVQVTTIDNQFESVLNVFPETLADWLSCTYGDTYPTSDEAYHGFDKLFHSVGKHSQKTCHLDRYNKYTFKITVIHRVEDGEIIYIDLLASNKFSDFIFLLQRGSHINYRGVLNADYGIVKLKRVNSTEVVRKKTSAQTRLDFTSAADESTKALLRFFFSPLITISDSE